MVSVKILFMGININLGMARKASKVNLPDQHVYKVHTAENQPALGYVMMETEGDIGRFNRAQRAMQVFLESFTMFLALFLLAGYVFPFPAFVLAGLAMMFQVVSAVGYTGKADARMGGKFP